MDNKNIEIEAKFNVLDINFLKSWLNKYAEFICAKDTVDTYYMPAHRNFLDVEYPYEWLRIRSEEKEFSINYKHWYPENFSKSTHCDEFETRVESQDIIKKIFFALNFKKIAVVDKHREKYMLNNFEFCLDNVADLGYFLEIEYRGAKLDIASANKKFKDYENYLSSALGQRNYRGYPYLIMKKNKRP